MRTVCKQDLCTGCNACVVKCPVDAIKLKDDMKKLNAIIDFEKCIGCNACINVCQNEHEIMFRCPISWYQGWCRNDKERESSSSGGFAYGLSKYFIDNGGAVCSCVFEQGQFIYKIIEDDLDLNKFKGSKYVKSNTGRIYIRIKELLKKQRRILFIGLPCHVSGLLEYLNGMNIDNLYTVDLICHGSPSAKILKKYLEQHKYYLDCLKNISFRNKGNFQLILQSVEKNTGEIKEEWLNPNGIKDFYSVAFLQGLIYTENCYSCKFARIERVSDITIGDSWGSELPENEKKKGISLALCQTEKGKKLIENCGIHLEKVELEKAIRANHQLQAPSEKVKERQHFFNLLQERRKFDTAVRKCFPQMCFRQDIKKILTKLHIKRF